MAHVYGSVRASLLGAVLVACTLLRAHATHGREDEVAPPLRLLRVHAASILTDGIPPHRELAGGDPKGSGVCHDSGSFLGVGNVDCLNQNLGTAIFLLGIIIVVSLLFERGIQFVRRAISCPQLKRIVNRIFEEIMIMGFISMIIFTLNTSGAMKRLSFKFDGDLSASDRLHFYEFFHYIVFLTMIYFILIVLLLLFIGTVVPKVLWEIKQSNDSDDEDSMDDEDEYSDDTFYDDQDDFQRKHRGHRERDVPDDETDGFDNERLRRDQPSVSSMTRGGIGTHRPSTIRPRMPSGMDLVQGSRAYSLLRQRYQRKGWWFRFNLPKQWQLWKSFEILAYNICQNRSGYIYKNPLEMERLFGVKPRLTRARSRLGAEGTPTTMTKPMTYDQYNSLCMRNLLYHISHMHFSAFFILLVISVLPVLYPSYDHWIFIGVGAFLLLVNVAIFFKVLTILRGIVDDRLRVLTNHDIQQLMNRSFMRRQGAGGPLHLAQRGRPTLRAVAQAVRAIIRMQMSSLCHRQLHFHDDRFWFNSPRFLLRLFHFATIGQAFYLVWFTLVEWQTVARSESGAYLIIVMVLLPLIALCVITPMTMPSLVLVMSLTGIFVDLNTKDPDSGYKPTQTETKNRIRLMRRSYLKSYYTDTDESVLPPSSPAETPQQPLRQSQIDSQQRSGGVATSGNVTPSSPSAVFLRMYDSPTAAAQHGKLVDASESPRRRRALSAHASPKIETGRRTQSFVESRDESEGYDDDVQAGTFSRHRRSFDLTSYHAFSNPVHRSPRKASLDLSSPRVVITSPAAAVAQSPASAAFKSYCSKYGGYPET